MSQRQIAKSLSVGNSRISEWLSDVLKAKKEEENKIIFDMYMACYTQEEIAARVDLDRTTVDRRIKELCESSRGNKITKLSSSYVDVDWQPPIYNIWNFAKKTNAVSHFESINTFIDFHKSSHEYRSMCISY